MRPSNVVLALARLGVLLALATACTASQRATPATLSIDGGRAVARGPVAENVKRCEVDGACYLVLHADGGDLHVQYHHGESPRCDNVASTRTGLAIAAGASVEAEGLYTRASDLHLLDVCCSDCRLRVIPDP